MTVAWLVAYLHESDVRPMRGLVAFFGKKPKASRVLLGTFFLVPWNAAGSVQATNTTTLVGQPLSSASLVALPAGGVGLPYSDVSRFSENSGLMVCEAKSSHVSMRVDVKFGGELLYSYSVRCPSFL